MKKIVFKALFLILIIPIAMLFILPIQIFANGEDSYNHQIVVGNAGENTTIRFWGTGYSEYYKSVTLYNNNSPDQIDFSFTIDNPWDLEMTNALPAGNYHYYLVISGNYDIINSELITYSDILLNERHDFTISNKQTCIITPPTWVRTMPMTCWQVWINEDGDFQFSFIYPYADNNWVRIYDMSGKMVYEIDMPYDNPNLIVDLPDGMYTVKTFTVGSTEPIQTFIIGK